MINFYHVTKENIKEHNLNWPKILNHPYRILTIGSYVSGKRNSLFNLINQHPYINNIYIQAKDPSKGKYQLPVNKREGTGLKHLNDS